MWTWAGDSVWNMDWGQCVEHGLGTVVEHGLGTVQSGVTSCSAGNRVQSEGCETIYAQLRSILESLEL